MNIEKGTYEIIRDRLKAQQKSLSKNVNALNEARKVIFGSVDFSLISSVRINTEHNCLARDIVSIGNVCLFGYNVRLGLKTILEVNDVFSTFSFENNEFIQQKNTLLNDDTFAVELQNLYKYYRHTRFSRFYQNGAFLYLVFQLSESPTDIKAFKWHVDGDKLTYVDSRSAAEVVFPKQHEFVWIKATRDMQRTGKKPHISIADKLFVQTLGGKLTIKVEDNTDEGKGVYSEDLEQQDQSLDDADISFCDLGNLVVLRVKPYLENDRYFIFNHRTKKVVRADSARDAVILLPDDQGVILSNGYYLQTGESKLFDRKIEGVKFLEKISSPNGEDHLFVFYEEKKHDFVLLSYNVIDQTVQNPIFCNGFTFFENGELCYFNTEKEPGKHHLIQIWQTPYADEFLPDSNHKDKELYKIGNQSIVRAMAEIQELNVLLSKEDSYNGLYEDIAQKSQSIIDAYFWLKNTEEATSLIKPLKEIRSIALSAIDEFEKVQEIKQSTKKSFDDVKERVDKIMFETRSANFDTLDQYVSLLTQLRGLRGEVIALKNLRYIDLEAVDQIDKDIAERSDSLSKACVSFLLKDSALAYYQKEMSRLEKQVNKVSKVIETRELEKEFDELAKKLELLIDIVNNLKVEDTSHSTKIIENITLIFSQLNQQRIALKNKRRQLSEKEAIADFKAQMTLFEQSVANYLDLASTPERCDEYLTKLSMQLEELESRFVDFDEFIDKISEKRESVYAAFESKKVSQVEARNRRAGSLFNSAQRVLKAIQSKAATFDTEAEINGYFAGDLMIERVRETSRQLEELDDSAKSEDLLNQINVLQQEAIRGLKDRKELFEDGDNIIRMGEHRFVVNKQNLDLALVVRDNTYYYHLTGTSYYEAVEENTLDEYRPLWNQELPSENRSVHRAEYLTWQVFKNLDLSHSYSEGQLRSHIGDYTSVNYGEGYVKGVHDEDAKKILKALIEKHRFLGLLRYNGASRALAQLTWHYLSDEKKQFYLNQIHSLALLRKSFPQSEEAHLLLEMLKDEITTFSKNNSILQTASHTDAARYLSEEKNHETFVVSREVLDFLEHFRKTLKEKNADIAFDDIKKEIADHPSAAWNHCLKWIMTYGKIKKISSENALMEATAFALTDAMETLDVTQLDTVETIDGIKSIRGENDSYTLDYHDFVKRLNHFSEVISPQYKALQAKKHQLIDRKKRAMRLHELQTQVLSSFVRNKLINDVYFPLIGANFAKQLGASGDDKRSDRSGMLLLISPPGYGKTTLMEYVAERLGLIFMKINGPSIGHEVTSVDPGQATNAGARQELEKLNLAFEMADNVMLYLDDIQHCNSEFLQKFISLADGQRRIEGVFKGESKTYDLRGKRFCVVMAGNPYTETGEKFQIPDMLSNRADIYNLGETAGNRKNLFDLSMIENGVSSNPFLRSLTQGGMENLYQLVRMVENNETEIPALSGNLSSQEIQDCLSVLRKALAARDVVLKVNAQYIRSAAMADDYREEPPFKLQGSYRDMNKLMTQIVPILKDEEVERILLDHYQNESQTLTSDTEANLLKLREIMDNLDEESKQRWESIKETYMKNRTLRGLGGNDRMSQVIAQLAMFNEGIDGIRKALSEK
ncbi:MAG: DNA repair ATPase [Cryomorphaceae bacterium]|nr:DNA repair ATPase [Cryomorphaceae bacterium]